MTMPLPVGHHDALPPCVVCDLKERSATNSIDEIVVGTLVVGAELEDWMILAHTCPEHRALYESCTSHVRAEPA